MNRVVVPLLLISMLLGCTHKSDPLERPLKFRESLLNANGTEFNAKITADYLDELYVFGLHCDTNESGVFSFSVTEPETIQGISGSISNEIELTFEDTVLALKPVKDDQLSPIMAPWLLIKALRSGYLYACSKTDLGYSVLIRDSYMDDAIMIEVMFDHSDKPYFAEYYWDDRRILSVEIQDFKML